MADTNAATFTRVMRELVNTAEVIGRGAATIAQWIRFHMAVRAARKALDHE